MSKKPKNNKSRDKKALHTLWGNADLTNLPAGKGNATVELNTSD